ncbi:MAG: alpha-L-fucosidase [Phocaeicola sp.]|uniref:alpha-L-fucosidase n=1 Tax=Phocaeicola sp. TaxID=2773926 RepID=UPI003F9F7968
MKRNIIYIAATISMLFFFSFTSLQAQNEALKYHRGKYNSSEESLKQYKIPEWFRDAKFGIWSHWGPQAVPREGDWYAKNMYVEGSRQNKYHVEHYGHPSKFGYKDIIDLWKAEKWNPEELIKLYKRVGAKYFVSMGSHHDNFFLWDSKLNKWNSVNKGPHKDVVGLWQQAAKKEGLYFGVSEHIAASYTWYQSAHSADKEGTMAGVPYDGNDPVYADLYHEKADKNDTEWYTTNPAWQLDWYNKVKELVDQYHPDLLYSDGKIPFDYVGRCQLANLYNSNTSADGETQTVYTCKHDAQSMGVLDVERGAVQDINPDPWQTDTSIGDWYYQRGQRYMTSDQVIQMLVDVVSKNGNLLLNVVQTPEGDLEQDVLDILEGIEKWMNVNGDAIYGSRPWKIYGEGPSMENQEKGIFGGVKDVRPYKPGDIRFTTKNGKLYIFFMEHPTESIKIKSLSKSSTDKTTSITSISMLGSKERIKWTQNDDSLVINVPSKLPTYATTVYEVQFKK